MTPTVVPVTDSASTGAATDSTFTGAVTDSTTVAVTEYFYS